MAGSATVGMLPSTGPAYHPVWSAMVAFAEIDKSDATIESLRSVSAAAVEGDDAIAGGQFSASTSGAIRNIYHI
jgi:hypothetical protein